MHRLFVLAGLLLAGCPHTYQGPPDLPPPFCSDNLDAGPPPTLATVEQITATNCAVSQCHDGPSDPFQAPPMMDLTPGHVYAAWVNVPAVETCGGIRVVPGDPASSYVYHKLADDMPCYQSQMPRCEVGACPLPTCEIELVRQWIADGAKQ